MRVAFEPIELPPPRSRSAYIVNFVDDTGRVGDGELAPLPGYSPDTLDAGRAAIEGVDWSDATVDEDVLAWVTRLGARIPASLPAAKNAVECAALDLAARARGLPAWKILCDAPEPLEVAALLDRDAPLESAEAAFARGIRTFKLKLGRDFDRELADARALRERFGRAVALRFDANQAWSAADARAHLEALAPLLPELVEEPTYELAALGAPPAPIALDESLQAPDASLDVPGVVAVVLKPMALGGITRCLDLAAQARARGLGVIVTHLFDGPVALASATALAFAIGSRSRAMGLDRWGAGPARIPP